MIKPTILLTGANGFIGSHLLEALIRNDYHVVVLKRSTSDLWRINHLLGQFNSYDIDVESVSSVFESEKIDIVVHLATLYRKFDNGSEISEMLDANVTFPTEVLEAGARYGIRGFINTGTFFEYDCSIQPVAEDAPIKPFNFYAKTKLAFDNILQTYSNSIAINTMRLFSPYGEKDNPKLLPMIIQKSLKNESIELSEGLQKIDLIYVSDIISAYIKAIERMSLENFQAEYETFNLGSGIALSIRDIVSLVEQCLGKNIDKMWGEASFVDNPIAYADITKLKKYLGWSPKYDPLTGIRNTILYYQEDRE